MMKDWYRQFEPPSGEENSESVVRSSFKTPRKRTKPPKPPKPEPPSGEIENPESIYAGAVALVQNHLDRVGAASKRDMQRSFSRRMDSMTLERVLYTLTEIGYLEIVPAGRIALYKISPSLGKGKK